MKVNPVIEQTIAAKVIADNAEREAKDPSGRLSASRLGWPLQWQMLHYYKVKPKSIEEYTLRKFARGIDVEDRIMKWLAPSPEKMQVPVEYREVVGFADVVLDYPIEVKSVTNRAFPYKQKEGASRGHQLQAALYSKALGFDKYAVAYVASDDYRVLCLEHELNSMDATLDAVIDRYQEQVKKGGVPVFVAEEKWQAMEEYSPYPEWTKLTEEQITAKLASMGITPASITS